MTPAAMTTEALKPCPFCGDMPEIRPSASGKLLNFQCPESSTCHGSGLIICLAAEKMQDAVSAWNRRVAEAELLTARSQIEAQSNEIVALKLGVSFYSGKSDRAEAERDAALARVRVLEEAQTWQPIESAPKDVDIIVFRPSMWGGKGHIGKAKWQDDKHASKPRPFWKSSEGWIGRLEDRQHQPTHWMPLPAPPSAALNPTEGVEG